MSEKRFELTKINPTVNLFDTVYFIIDYENPNKGIRTLKDCVDLLNTLHQENQSLKFELDECANNKIYSRRKLEEENEQLRQSIEDYKDHNSELEYELKKCREKNKELQDKIDKIIEELDQYRYNETLYAKEIVRLNNENYEFLRFKTLGGDY